MAVFPVTIQGGYDTDSGPSAPFIQSSDGIVVPYLTKAQNIVYSRDGWPRKMPGATRVNAITTGGTDAVMGIFDYWRSTTSGSPVQRRVISSGTAIYQVSSGALTAIKTGIEANKPTCFEVFDDVVVIATTGTTDVPWTWDQTTFANLGGTPPNFSFMVQHKDRMFAAGVDALKSRLYYSVSGDAADWVGAGSGSVDVTPDDGDQITGLASHKGELIIFKGPARGRILRLTGSSPSDFALASFVRGVGCSAHNAIITVNDDLIFWDHSGLHSLSATASYGDYSIAYLTDSIRSFVDSLDQSAFNMIAAVNYSAEGRGMWTVRRTGANQNDLILVWDYRWSPPRFAVWPAYNVASISIVRQSTRTIPWCGTYDGYVLRMNQKTTRTVGGVAFAVQVETPYLSLGDAFLDKRAMKGRVGYRPSSTETFSVNWRRDTATLQSAEITQATQLDTLADSESPFILDSSVLGGGLYAHSFFDMSGQFKELQLSFTQEASGMGDLELHSFALDLEPAGKATAKILG